MRAYDSSLIIRENIKIQINNGTVDKSDFLLL